MTHEVVWILAANAAAAHLFRADRVARRLELVRSEPHEAGRAKPSERLTDRPGRSFDSTRAGGRHAMEPDTDPRRAELHRFALQLATELDEAAAADRFARLVLVAPPRVLGELRHALPDRVAARVEREIDKDLAGLEPRRLEQALAELLWPRAE